MCCVYNHSALPCPTPTNCLHVLYVNMHVLYVNTNHQAPQPVARLNVCKCVLHSWYYCLITNCASQYQLRLVVGRTHNRCMQALHCSQQRAPHNLARLCPCTPLIALASGHVVTPYHPYAWHSTPLLIPFYAQRGRPSYGFSVAIAA